MRKVLLVILALLALAYVVLSFAELENILAALGQSHPLYLTGAVVAEAMLLLNTTATFWALYRLVGLRSSGRNMFLMTTAATFVNIVTPAPGVGGMAVFLDDARWRSLPPGRVAVAGVLYVLYEYIALFAALAAGFFVLVKLGKLNAAELTAATLLLVFAAFMATVVFVGYRSAQRLGDMLAWLARLANRLLHPFLHRDWLDLDSVRRFAEELTEALGALRSARLGQILLPLGFTLLNKVLLMVVLALAFLALDTPVDAGTVVAGFSIGHLFVYASPTPSGIGFVDSILPLALKSLDVPFLNAVLVALLYRAFTLWLPLVLGALAFRILQRSHGAQARSLFAATHAPTTPIRRTRTHIL